MNGETQSTSIAMLALLTGQVGLPGTNTGAREGDSYGIDTGLPTGKNPVKVSFPIFLWPKAVIDAKSMTSKNAAVRGADHLSHNIKFIWNTQGNTLINQHGGINQLRKILEDDKLVETIVVVDNQMTPSAKFADYVLPDVFEKLFGVETISILRDDRFNLQLLLFFNVITAFGANVILYTNAMNSVDISIYEAARMDGAVNLQILTKITIPMSYPTIMTFVVTSVSMIFTADVSNYLFYDFNAPVNTTTVGYYLFYLSKSEFADYNMASVLSIVFTLITFPIVMLVRWGLEKADPMSDRAEVAKCKAK